MANFILFGTEGCHLCEDAERLLSGIDLVFEKQDILHDGQWMQRYALSIPVLVHQPSGSELAWPFSVESLNEFILQISVSP